LKFGVGFCFEFLHCYNLRLDFVWNFFIVIYCMYFFLTDFEFSNFIQSMHASRFTFNQHYWIAGCDTVLVMSPFVLFIVSVKFIVVSDFFLIDRKRVWLIYANLLTCMLFLTIFYINSLTCMWVLALLLIFVWFSRRLIDMNVWICEHACKWICGNFFLNQ
jgi:hypothetical protein